MPVTNLLRCSLVALLVTAAAAPGALATQSYSTSFDAPPHNYFVSINGQQGWSGNGEVVSSPTRTPSGALKVLSGDLTHQGFGAYVTPGHAPIRLHAWIYCGAGDALTDVSIKLKYYSSPIASVGVRAVAETAYGFYIGNGFSEGPIQYTSLPLGTWRRLSLVLDFQADSIAGYVDGLPLGKLPIPGSLPLEINSLQISSATSSDLIYIDDIDVDEAMSIHTVRSASAVLTVTDLMGRNSTLTMSQPSAGQASFAAPYGEFWLDGGGTVRDSTGPVSLGGVSSVVMNMAAGADTVVVSGPISGLPSLTLDGGIGDDLVSFSGAVTLADHANLNIDLQNDTAPVGVDRIALASGAQVATLGSGAITLRCSRDVSLGTGASLQSVNGALLIEANRQLSGASTGDFIGVDARGALIRANGTGPVSVYGRGGDGVERQYGVCVDGGGSITGGSAGTTLVDGIGGASLGAANAGVRNFSGTITSLGSAVRVVGLGGGALNAGPFQTGVLVSGTGIVTAGGNSPVTVEGTGGTGSGFQVSGVQLQLGGTITSGGGDVTVTGLGSQTSTDGTLHAGVTVIFDGVISAGGAGRVTVTGTGGSSGGNDHRGINIENNGRIQSGSGAITLNGQGGGNAGSSYQYGLITQIGGRILSGSGDITLTCTGGGVGGVHQNEGIYINNETPTGIASGGHLDLISDRFYVAVSSRISAPASRRIRVMPKTANRSISLFNANLWTPGDNLWLSDTQLACLNAGTLEFGSANSGPVDVNGPVVYSAATAMTLLGSEAVNGATAAREDLAQAGAIDAEPSELAARRAESASPSSAQVVTANFVLRSGNKVEIFGAPSAPNGFDTGGGSLLVAPGPGSVFRPTAFGTDVTAPSFSAAPGSQFLAVLDNSTPGTGYSQLVAAGPVDLTGMSILIGGSYTPAVGDTFVLVKNGPSPTIGTFNGLPEGTVVPNFLGTGLAARISYAYGPDQDVMLAILASALSVDPVLPVVAGLAAASPSPFARSTELSFGLTVAGRVELTVFSVDGRRVRTLASGEFAAGRHSRTWDGTNDAGSRVHAGVYYLRLTTPQGSFKRSVVMVE